MVSRLLEERKQAIARIKERVEEKKKQIPPTPPPPKTKKKKEEKVIDITSPTIKATQEKISRIKERVEEKKQQFQQKQQLDYLITHASPREKLFLEKAIKSRVPMEVRDVLFQRAATGAFQSLTDEEKISYAKQYYKFGDEEKTWAEIKQEQPDWELKIKDDKITVATPLTDTSTLFSAMGKEYEKSPGILGAVRAGTIAYASWFRPETWREGFKGIVEGGGVLTGGILGVQPRIGYKGAVETLKWEYGLTKIEDPFVKWLKVQQPAYENVILPFVGGAVLGKASKIFQGAKHIWSPGTRIVLGGSKVVVGGTISTVIGADIGYTAAMEQKGYLESGALASKLGKYAVQFAFMAAGYKAGSAWKLSFRSSDVRVARNIAARYTKQYGSYPRYDVNLLASGKYMRGDTFTSWWRKPSGLTGFKPGDRSDIFLYGRKGMVSPREGLTTLEQVWGKTPDPFMSYKPSIWGAYGQSWSYYRQSIAFEVPTRTPVKTRVPYKITTGEGQAVLKGVISSRLGLGKIQKPIFETGQLPKEFRTISPSAKNIFVAKTHKVTPLRFTKVIQDPSIFMTEKPTTPSWLSAITKGKGGIPTRYAIKHDVTDYRLLKFLEGLEPSYQPVTSVLAPSHISLFAVLPSAIRLWDRSDVKLDTKSLMSQIGISVSIHKVAPKTMMDTKTDLLSIQKSLSISINTSITDSISSQKNLSANLTKSFQQQLQKQGTIQKQSLQQAMIYPPQVTLGMHLRTTRGTPGKGKGGYIPHFDTTFKLFGHTFGQGYNVKVRERHYVKGKKVKEGKFIKINKRPLDIDDAESLRGMALDKSAAASGKIVPVNAMAQESLIDLKPFESIEHKFYLKDNVLIEKSRYRIDSKGEVEGISALGWYAERAKKAAKKKTTTGKPRVRQPKAVDMFDMDMDGMLINMDKLFKGVFNGFR